MISHKLVLNFLSLFIDLSLQICYPVLLLGSNSVIKIIVFLLNIFLLAFAFSLSIIFFNKCSETFLFKFSVSSFKKKYIMKIYI